MTADLAPNATVEKPGTGAASRFPVPPPVVPEKNLSPAQWGMIAFLFSEVAFFSTLIVAYLTFYGRDGQPGGLGGPEPLNSLSLPLALGTTFCLLASSVSIHGAEDALRKDRPSVFRGLWSLTIVLGIAFLCGTAYEWSDLIGRHHLTISRNLFGTTFYTLVGFHGLHVSVGVLLMLIVLQMGRGVSHAFCQLVSWYWHFVDGVWIVVFSVVYLMPFLG
jgi:cytochrome c oxidase subunit III